MSSMDASDLFDALLDQCKALPSSNSVLDANELPDLGN